MALWPVHQPSMLAVGAAVKQGYRIEPCPVCGGPEIFSKIQPKSRCFRCGALREHMAVKQHKTSWRRCALCNKPAMAGISLDRRYCAKCQSLSDHERAKRRRWKAERESTIERGASQTPITTGLISPAPPEIDPQAQTASNDPTDVAEEG